MNRILFVLLGAFAVASPGQTRSPVVLELFTSEGCSSCPPADRLLEELDREQPVRSAEVIVLSEHVDYWNHLGWSDPYSSAAFSERQERYSGNKGDDGIYTPQLVVDGDAKFVGSDRREAIRSIEKAALRRKIAVSVTARREGNQEFVRVDAPDARAGGADVYIALASDRAQSQVRRGENAGRALSHVSVVYSLIKAESGHESPIPVKPGKVRVIAFVQERGGLRILGAAQTLN